MQSHTPSPTTYLLSSGRGIRCRAARDQGHDIINLEVQGSSTLWQRTCLSNQIWTEALAAHLGTSGPSI